MQKVIGFGHKAQKGKTESANYLVKKYGFKKISFASRLKDTAGILFDLSDEQKYGREKLEVDPFWEKHLGDVLRHKYPDIKGPITPVVLFQIYGTESIRTTISDNMWILIVMKEILGSPETNYVIDDVRFKNEASFIENIGGLVIRVDRDNAGITGRSATHSSEIDLDDFTYWSYILDNNSTLTNLYDGLDLIMENTNKQ